MIGKDAELADEIAAPTGRHRLAVDEDVHRAVGDIGEHFHRLALARQLRAGGQIAPFTGIDQPTG